MANNKTDSLDTFLKNNYSDSDLEKSEESIDGYSEAESVDLRENSSYQVFSTLLEDDKGKNVSSNIETLGIVHKKELQKINANLEQLNKTFGAVYGLIRDYMKCQLGIARKSKSSSKSSSSKKKNSL
jgi:hypothetical protein